MSIRSRLLALILVLSALLLALTVNDGLDARRRSDQAAEAWRHNAAAKLLADATSNWARERGATNGALNAADAITAQAREAGTSGTQGTVVAATSGANTSGMDTVFADAAGATDAQYDGKHSAKDDYTVSAATLSVLKTSTLISDPVNGTTNPKAIPGATIEYCIIVSNGAGSATATGITVTDPLPTTTTYVTGTTYVDGTATSGVCNSDGTLGGSFASGTVSGTLSNIAGGQTKTLRFRATIN